MPTHYVESFILWGGGGTLTTNRRPFAILVICPLGQLVNNFMLDWTASSFAMCFSLSFGGSIVIISVDKSTWSRADVSALRSTKIH